MKTQAEFIAECIWKTIKANGTMGFCYREDLLANIIERAIKAYDFDLEFIPLRPQDEVKK